MTEWVSYPDEEREFDFTFIKECFKFVLKTVFVFPYRLCQILVRLFGKTRWILFCALISWVLFSWVSEYQDYHKRTAKVNQARPFLDWRIEYRAREAVWFMFHPKSEEEFWDIWDTSAWMFYFESFSLDLWFHYFVVSFVISTLTFQRKKKNTLKMKCEMDKKTDLSILGYDFLSLRLISTDDHVESHIEITGEESGLRNMMVRLMDMDVRHGSSVVIVALQEGKELLSQVSHVLEKREKKEEIRNFFYYSANDPKRSVIYSPFYPAARFDLLASWFEIGERAPEYELLRILVDGLNSQPKVFELDDLILLLQDQRAAIALGNKWLMKRYLSVFESQKKTREKLILKLIQFSDALRLARRPITAAFAIGLEHMLDSGHHLYLELVNDEPELLIRYLLSDLGRTINGRAQAFQRRISIYLMHPEKLNKFYPMKTYFEPLSYNVDWRIFSKTPYFPKGGSRRWNHLFLKNWQIPEDEFLMKDHHELMGRFNEEKKRLRNQFHPAKVLNEETFESVRAIIQEANLKDNTALGFFDKYRKGEFIRWFYLPSHIPAEKEYVAYQPSLKPEHMLHLRKKVNKMKRDGSDYDPGVSDIIQDLKSEDDS